MKNYTSFKGNEKVDEETDFMDIEEINYIIGYNNIKFPENMKFIPDLTYRLIDMDELKKHPRYNSIYKRYGNKKKFYKFKKIIEDGKKIPERLWPIVPQGTKAWLGIRTKGFLTGSTVSSFIGLKLPKYRKLLGLSHYYEENENNESFDRIRLKDKYKRPPIDLVQNVFMSWGDHEYNAIYTLLEHYSHISIEEWGFKPFDKSFLPDIAKRNDFVKKWLPNIGASPDGIINNLFGKRWLLEVKCPTPFFPNRKKPLDGYFFKVYEPKIKNIYIAQMYIQSLVWGIKDVLHVIYTVEHTYIYQLKIDEKILLLLIKIICKSHENFQKIFEGDKKSGIPKSLDIDIVKFIEYCNGIIKKMKKNEIRVESVNNQLRRRKYIFSKKR